MSEATDARPTLEGTPSPSLPPLVPQPNGRGALYAGGVPGNRSALGRTSKVRLLALQGLVEATPEIAKIAKGERPARGNSAATEEVSYPDQMAATRLLAGLALGQRVPLGLVKEKLRQMLHTIDEWAAENGASETDRQQLLNRLDAAWREGE